MVLSDLGCGSGSFDLVFLYQADRHDVVCHLVGRGRGMTRVQSNAQCAQAASSGKLVVAKLHARFHFGRVGFETWSHAHTTWPHTQSFTHIILSHTSFTHNFITHNSSRTTFLNTYRSSTASFVFPSFLPSFPAPLQLLILLIGRS